MNKILEVKTATITSKGQITIPKELREQTGFKTGSKVVFITQKDRMELIPMDRINDAYSAFLMIRKSQLKERESLG